MMLRFKLGAQILLSSHTQWLQGAMFPSRFFTNESGISQVNQTDCTLRTRVRGPLVPQPGLGLELRMIWEMVGVYLIRVLQTVQDMVGVYPTPVWRSALRSDLRGALGGSQG